MLDGFAQLPQTGRVLDAVRRHQQRKVGGLWGGSAALLLAVLVERRAAPTLVLCADDEDAAELEDDLACFTGKRALRLPEQELDIEGRPEPQALGARLRALQEAAADQGFLMLAGLRALVDAVPRPRALSQGRITLRAGDRLRQEDLLATAIQAGLHRVPVVLGPGEISPRGDVVDLYPLGASLALRLEFLDDVLESIRSFDPASQLSHAVLQDVAVALGSAEPEMRGHVIEHLGHKDLLLVRHEPLRLDEARQALTVHHRDAIPRLALLAETAAGFATLDLSSLPSHDIDFKVLSAGSAAGSGEQDPAARLRSIRGLRGEVRLYCRTEQEQARLAEIFAHKGVSLAAERVTLALGALHRGFRVPELGLTVISNVEFAGQPQAARARERHVVPGKAIRSFFELGPGDLVVHAAHGIALFEGIELVERGEGAEDHLRLCFRNDVRLLVPASKIHLIQKYVGAGDAKPQLDRLGGKGFARRKAEVSDALLDLAAELLDVQGRRTTSEREPYPPDPLEAAFLDGFPFTDTDDQRTAWAEIARDLEGRAPMDRLLCGDVGFGKTELAMRAAFRVAVHGRQVAVLVPTTLLADQHGQTFAQRFAPHGLTVEVLSRLRTGKEQSELLARLASGRVDVLIGTHRVLSDDVRFHDLGLLVIDEEQRFGVRHKEQLKRLRLLVDVLTLSATPIPRTLHASLLGVRSISTLATPPPGRQEVETRMAWTEPALLQEALERELARGGQAFVLHNRIETLDMVAQEVRRLVPAARVAIGHGQMSAAETERTVRRFVKGDVDVLVSTTIVENGLDLPRANTILIDRAERFGLAELHQLRGRVGRSDRRAHCLLLLHRDHPPTEEAKRRLKALEELSHLGAGFAIAMKDLEIRGAGNLLGPEQSGHIAAVGYDMYCQLLRAAVESAKTSVKVEPVVREVDVDLRVQAFVPDALAPEPRQRLELLRELDAAVDPAATRALALELADRFGPLPPPLRTLLLVFLLKHLLLDHGVHGVQHTGDRIVVHHPPAQPLGGAWLDAFADVRLVEAGKTHLVLPRRASWTGEQVLAFCIRALAGKDSLAMIESAWRERRGSPSGP